MGLIFAACRALLRFELWANGSLSFEGMPVCLPWQ